jgi:hypothetical protein
MKAVLQYRQGFQKHYFITIIRRSVSEEGSTSVLEIFLRKRAAQKYIPLAKFEALN